MTWLITGGAGYIGAHIVRQALESGREVVVVDDLSTGVASKIPSQVPIIVANLLDQKAVEQIFNDYSITGVLHTAARKQVGESVLRPLYYWEENVGGLTNLLSSMQLHQVKNFVFSSSAAVYGQPELAVSDLITEELVCNPINPYGATKLAGEWMAAGLVSSDDFRVASLRYFNVAGAASPDLGDTFALNLIPIVMQAITNGEQPKIFGTDYPTPDGSCIRDYIHVQDLADAHVAAMDLVEKSEPIFQPINLGTGIGTSVYQVIDVIRQVTGKNIEPILAPRRAGDPPALVADPSLAKTTLGWNSQYDLTQMVESAWTAWQKKN
ncbi:MAG: UDP-glucose 4-epimerase GalE [Actinomycetales bacterium]|nr:UDP-glucose 4-epimerase GalE [Actinomycetales bacterium]